MILHTSYPGLSGATDICLKVCIYFEKFFTNSIIFFGKNEKIRKEYKVQLKKKKIIYKKVYYNNLLLAYINFFLLLKQIKPKTIFLHNYNIIPTIIYKFFFFKNLRIFTVVHSDFNQIKEKKLLLFLFKFIFFFSEKVIFVNSVPKYFNNRYKKKCFIISNGIDASQYKGKKNKRNKSIQIGMASRLVETKRIDLLLQAILVIKSKLKKKINLKIAGSGNCLIYFKSLSKKLKLQENVEFLGDLEKKKLIKFYKNLDIYVHISEAEFKSVAIIQAMSCCLPIVASNIKNNFFIKDADKNNVLVENNVNSIAEKIMLSLKKIKPSSKNRLYALKECDLKVMQKKYLQLIS